MPQFIVHNQDEQEQMIAVKLPDGDFWLAKHAPDTNLYKLLLAIGIELLRLEGKLNYTDDELSLIRTQDLIDEWEFEYGIADSCLGPLSLNADLQTRITNILTLIFSEGTNIETKYEAVALRLGLIVDVFPGGDISQFTYTFPILFLGDPREIRYTIIVDMKDVPFGAFTYQFPFTFGDFLVSILKCLFNQLKPANCRVLFINEGGFGSSSVGGFSDGFSSGFDI